MHDSPRVFTALSTSVRSHPRRCPPLTPSTQIHSADTIHHPVPPPPDPLATPAPSNTPPATASPSRPRRAPSPARRGVRWRAPCTRAYTPSSEGRIAPSSTRRRTYRTARALRSRRRIGDRLLSIYIRICTACISISYRAYVHVLVHAASNRGNASSILGGARGPARGPRGRGRDLRACRLLGSSESWTAE